MCPLKLISYAVSFPAQQLHMVLEQDMPKKKPIIAQQTHTSHIENWIMGINNYRSLKY